MPLPGTSCAPSWGRRDQLDWAGAVLAAEVALGSRELQGAQVRLGQPEMEDPLVQAGLPEALVQPVHLALAQLVLAEQAGQQDLSVQLDTLALQVLHLLPGQPVRQVHQVLELLGLRVLGQLARQASPAVQALMGQLAAPAQPGPEHQVTPVLRVLRAAQAFQEALAQQELAEQRVRQVSAPQVLQVSRA